MVSHVLRPEIGAVGAMLYYDNNTIQHAGVILGIGKVAGHSHKYYKREKFGYFSRLKIIQNYSAVTGASMLVKKQDYISVNGLNSEQLSVAFNAIDFSLKLLEIKKRNIWTPYAELYNHESISRGHDNTEIKKKRFSNEMHYMLKIWNKQLKNDKYNNIKLKYKHKNNLDFKKYLKKFTNKVIKSFLN